MRLSEDQSKLLQIARISLSGAASSESMLWNGIDASDPEERRYGDFELLERIGQGGMGVVYRARQISLDRDVAIKFIVGTLADNARAIATFAAEARAAARLHHPNIVPVFETGRVEGLYYFSMPLLRGQTLAQRLDRAPMPVPEIVKLMSTLCAAVAYAHSVGLLH